MAGSLLPLLLLGGGAALLLTSSKKKKGGIHGFRLVGDCEGIAMYNNNLSVPHASQWFTENGDGTAEDVSRFYATLFPQCQWPPENPEAFIAGGMSYADRVKVYLAAYGALEEELDAGSAQSVGQAIGGVAGRSFSGPVTADQKVYTWTSKRYASRARARGFNGVTGLASRPGATSTAPGRRDTRDMIYGDNAGATKGRRRRRRFAGDQLLIVPFVTKTRARRRVFGGGVEEIAVTAQAPSASTGRRWRKSRGGI